MLSKLAKEQPIFTPEWDTWTINRRDVPVEGTWTVIGHEPSRGDVVGSVAITKSGEDEFETTWNLKFGSEAPLVRKGKGVLYAGYSWRGTSETFAPGEAPLVRETLLLSEDWQEMRGRIFSGEYHELGLELALYRRSSAPRIDTSLDAAVMIPSQSQVIRVFGSGFDRDLRPSDFHLGQGVQVVAVDVRSETELGLHLHVARDAKRGTRKVSMRALPGPTVLTLYDTVDYIKITPGEGLSRVGGEMRGKQLERFEAIAMNRGLDDEPYTEDDFVIEPVQATWSLEEFPVRVDDDDLEFVGAIDADTGVFTPALDGPNPERRWSANNIGDVYVTAVCTLTVRDIPKPPEEPESEGETEAALEPEPVDPNAPIAMVDREFRARGHLLVTIPIYVNWSDYEASQR